MKASVIWLFAPLLLLAEPGTTYALDCSPGEAVTMTLISVTEGGEPVHDVDGYVGFTVALRVTGPKTITLAAQLPQTGTVYLETYEAR